MIPTAKLVIDFSVLDDVLLAPRNRSDQIRRMLATRTIDAIGPAVEYALQYPRFSEVLPALEALPESDVTTALLSVLRCDDRSRHLRASSFDPLRVEFAMLGYRESAMDGAGWVAYLQRLKNAAKQGGFGDSTAKGLVGAVKELVENVDLHSETPDSGVIGYGFTDQSFEFVIADTGIGVLASLRRCTDYEHLADHGDALLTALTDGESRFGRKTNHGRGFRQLFVALAALYGSLRFRSGNHRLEIEGNSPNLPTSKVSQSVTYKGFMASVTCRPSNLIRKRA